MLKTNELEFDIYNYIQNKLINIAINQFNEVVK